MHDISAEAGISVGLIYRYFKSKEAVISAMAAVTRKRFTKCSNAPGRRRLYSSLSRFSLRRIAAKTRRRFNRLSWSIFTLKSSRNPQVADLVRDVLQTAMDGVTDLISRSPEAEKLRTASLPANWPN